MNLVYDVCHNIAKLEEHTIGGKKKKVWVHRKGATRAFPPHHPEIPKNAAQGGTSAATGLSQGHFALGATGDVGIGNPFLGSGGPRGMQIGAKVSF